MKPSRAYEAGAVDRTFAGTGLDRGALRLRAKVTASRVPDSEFDDLALSACDLVESRTGLFLYSGSYAAEFDLSRLVTNNAWRAADFQVPGTNASIASIKSGETNLVARKTVPISRNGSQRALAPTKGWNLSGLEEPVEVAFTAGGAIPPAVVSAIASHIRFQVHETPNEALVLDYLLEQIEAFGWGG